MSLSPQNQIKGQLDSAENILILTPLKATNDSVAASWGLFHFLKNLGKNPTVLENDSYLEKLGFLVVPDKMEKQIVGARDFMIQFSTKYNKILAWRAEDKGETFDIYVTPEKETIDPRDFSFIPAKFKYDLVIILGAENLEQLGPIREKNSDLFFEVPIVNIDFSNANEKFGQFNSVDVMASSISEVVSEIMREISKEDIDEKSAECFLTGLIAATSNFQSARTTPQTFLTASWLIERGASQQEIVRRLLKTQSFPFMKLWGRVMARLNWDEKLKLAWSLVSIEDFVQSRTTEDILPLVLEKISDNFSSGKTFAIIYGESLKKNIALVKSSDAKILETLKKDLKAEATNGHLAVTFENKDILEAEKELLKKLEQ